MKVGDLVRFKRVVGRSRPTRAGLVVRVFEHKMWRTDARGPSVNWDKVPLEPFVEVLFGENTINLPVGDVEVINGNT